MGLVGFKIVRAVALTATKAPRNTSTGGVLRSTCRLPQCTMRAFCTRPQGHLSLSSTTLFLHSRQCVQHHALRRFLNTSTNAVTSTSESTSTRVTRFTLLVITLGIGLGGSIYLLQSPIRLDASSASLTKPLSAQTSPEKSQPSLTALIRAYFVYTLCSIPVIVDASPTLLKYSFAIPGVRWIAEKAVRGTFFAQFVGGDTAEEALPIVASLRNEGKGTLFAYSVEVDEGEASGSSPTLSTNTTSSNGAGNLPVHKRIVEEMVHSVDVAADFEDGIVGREVVSGRRTWVAVKLTALLPNIHAMHRLSAHLVKTRPPLPRGEVVPFPGTPRNDDLDILDVVKATTTDGVVAPPGSTLTPQDLHDLRELRDNLFRICQRAKERGVRIIIDAEYSWFQPAVDAYTLELMRKFNRLSPKSSSETFSFKKFIDSKRINENKLEEDGRVQPLVYGTYQAYLRRTHAQLAHDVAASRAEGFSLGVKLVRGAYHTHEIAAHPSSTPFLLSDSTTLNTVNSAEVSTTDTPEWTQSRSGKSKSGQRISLSISPEPIPPVWLVKEDTDRCYNSSVGMLVKAVAEDLRAKRGPSLGILFGTHNWQSSDVVLGELVKAGLATKQTEEGEEKVLIPDEVNERVTMGQLYGMSDALANSIVERTKTTAPFVIKYVPYGALVEVMPYLSRRAIENKTVLGGRGGAAEERRRAGKAIMEKLFGGFGYRAN